MDNDGVNQKRRRVLGAMTAAVGGAGAVGVVVPFIGSWNPSARAKAAGAPVTVDIGKIEPGGMVTAEWRGKPVFVLRRTEEALGNLAKLVEKLKDPQSEVSKQPSYVDSESRAIKEEYVVLLGLCTHLGCSPKLRADVGAADLGGAEWLGGFFCPCHGSKFDLAGRVYSGAPATTNLEVPPYRYVSDTVIVIGEDQGTV
ncbi:MAG: ubiquinol-cytochrome c reductase iron-sulfur subunit [Pseudomonadales bacterium]